jgi:hypothetical protein
MVPPIDPQPPIRVDAVSPAKVCGNVCGNVCGKVSEPRIGRLDFMSFMGWNGLESGVNKNSDSLAL